MSHPPQHIRFCTSRDGTRIAYATCGSGRPLVWAGHWVHHLKFDWDSPVWRSWLSTLMRCHRLIRYDWRGCGLSDRDGIDFSFEKYLEDFEAVIEATGLKRFVFVGMGAGAAVGMAHAVRHPEQITRLVLYGCCARGRLTGGASQEQVQETETRLKVLELGWPNETPAYGQFFTALHMPDASAEQFRAYNDLVRLTTSPANAIRLLRTFHHRVDLREIIPKIRCPTLVLHSRKDAIVPFDEGRLVASLIPGSRFVPLESRNHVLLDTEPAWQQFVEALDDFLPAPPAAEGAVEFMLDDLTVREHQVLELIAQGQDNETIAARLGITAKTVRNQVSTIFSKLGVNSRAQAIVLARDVGFGRKGLG